MKLGIIGCGEIAHWHADAANLLPDVDLVASFDVESQASHRFARRYGLESVDSIAALATRADAVVVAVPPTHHVAATEAALIAGLDVLLEKPLAPTLTEGQGLVEAARRASRTLHVAEAFQHWAPVRVVADAIQSNMIGEVRTATATMSHAPSTAFFADGNWRHSRALAGGGVIMDSGPHYIRALRMFIGEVTSVSAVVPADEDDKVETSAHVLMRSDHGTVATMSLALSPAVFPHAEIFSVVGTHGALSVNEAGVCLRRPSQPDLRLSTEGAATYRDSFVPQLAAFRDAVRYQDAERHPAEDGLRDLAVIEATYRSLDSRRWESVAVVGGPTSLVCSTTPEQRHRDARPVAP